MRLLLSLLLVKLLLRLVSGIRDQVRWLVDVSEEQENSEWEEWTEEYGYLASEIYNDIKSTSHLLNVDDGNHAKWHEDSLAVMIVLPFEHAMAFSAESEINDFENSPLHSHVFAIISGLILASADAMDDSDYEVDE